MNKERDDERYPDRVGEWRVMEGTLMAGEKWRDASTPTTLKIRKLNSVQRIIQYQIQWVETKKLSASSPSLLEKETLISAQWCASALSVWESECKQELRLFRKPLDQNPWRKTSYLEQREAVTWRRLLVVWQVLLAYQTCAATLNTSKPHPNTHGFRANTRGN